MSPDLDNNPFAALGALRDSLPEGPGNTGAADTGADARTAMPAVTLSIFYERKGRAGKEATIIVCPDTMSEADAQELAARLKRSLGTGGSCRGGEILLQGDRRKPVRDLLTRLGYKTKGC